MKKILVINPTTTEKWNSSDEEYLQGKVGSNTQCSVLNVDKGPESIETFTDEGYALPGILDLVRAQSGNFDAVMINCFADPGLYAARELAACPVTGAAQSSMALATQLFPSFVVISIFENSSGWIKKHARRMGLDSNLAGVTGVDIPVLKLEKNREQTVKAIVAEAKKLLNQTDAEGVILGCTGMAQIAENIDKRLNVAVIEPAAVAIKTAEMMAHLGLSHRQGKFYLSPD